jgi:hypothetical protein
MFVTLQQSAGLFIRYLLDYPMSKGTSGKARTVAVSSACDAVAE